jgi:hypothetical protein
MELRELGGVSLNPRLVERLATNRQETIRYWSKVMIKSRLAIFATALTLSACGSNNTAGSNADAPGSTASQAVAINQSEMAASLTAAGEPFEVLAETAFTATAAELDKSILAADGAANMLKTIVPATLSASLQTRLTAIRQARKADQRVDLSLASIEGFRDIVSAVPGTPAVPIDVSLLDYAGFRYDADAQAKTPRWDDMAAATSFARERWATLSGLAPLAKLRTRFETGLNAMDAAVRARNVTQARAAAKAELAMVDELEVAFPKSK